MPAMVRIHVGWIAIAFHLVLKAQIPMSLSDGSFAPDKWVSRKIADTGGDGSFTTQTMNSGGNPGAFRDVTITFKSGTVTVSHLRLNGPDLSYSPQQQGAISGVAYSYDLKAVEARGATKYQLAIYQNGTTYACPQVDVASFGDWLTFQSSFAYGAAYFVKMDGPGPDRPDFSASGSTLYFGYITSGGSTSTYCGMYGYCSAGTWETGLDNLIVKLSAATVVPTGPPACTIKPQNLFLAAHRPIHHLNDPRHPVHVLTVTATASGTAIKGAAVTLRASRAVFTASPSQPPSLNSLTSTTDSNGRAAFGIDPPEAIGFDRTDIVANVTSGGQTASCSAAVVVGMGTMTVPLHHFMDGPAKSAMLNGIQDRLLALQKELREHPPELERLQKRMRAHRTLLRKIVEGKFSELSGRDMDALSRLADYVAYHTDSPFAKTLFFLKRDLAEAHAVAQEIGGPQPGGVPSPQPRPHQADAQAADGIMRAKVQAAYAQFPLSFEPNRGQVNSRVRFVARTPRYNVYLAPDEFVIFNNSSRGWPFDREQPVRMRLAGAGRSPRVMGVDEQPGKSNYLVGADTSRWRADVPHFGQVKYEHVYPGIDMLLHGNGRTLQFDFVVAPQADPARIGLVFQGIEDLEVDSTGALVLHRSSGSMRLAKPVIYQETGGERRNVSGGYTIRGADEAGFQIANYDRNAVLVIDPILSYATFLGGSNDDAAMAIAADAQGDVYITGATSSPNYPVANGMQPVLAGDGVNADAFVTKLDPAGNIVYSTYIGGSGGDIGMGIAVDASGNAYVTGATTSADFPLSQAIQGGYHGGSSTFPGDAFVLKLNASGSGLVYSTYWGGSGGDVGKAIAVDTNGNAYVTGFTNSTDLPTRNALQATNQGGYETFLVKLNAAGTDFVYATYLGGSSDDDIANAIAVDGAGNVYLTGATFSADFPTRGPLQAKKGEADAFVLKLNPSGSGLIYSTFLGGANSDAGLGIAVDANGNAYVTGMTASPDFPLANAAQTKFAAPDTLGAHAFVTKLDPSGSKLLYSTFLGGKGTDVGMGIAVGPDGSAYVAGETDSPDFPLAGAFQGASGSSNGFVANLNAAGSGFSYATLLGGGRQNTVTGIALDSAANVYVAGLTTSEDFPVTYGAPGMIAQGQTDALVAKIVEGTPPPRVVSFSAASLQPVVARGSIAAAYGASLAASAETAAAVPLPVTLAGINVKVKDSSGAETSAPLFYASTSQINYLVPQEAAPGLAAVTVLNGDQTVAAGTVRVDDVAPGLFAANGSGQGVASAVGLRVANDQTQTRLDVYQCGAGAGSCVALPLDLGGDTDSVFLLLFGTGIQNRSSLSAVSATIGGVDVPVLFAGPQGDSVGLDQVNVGPIPATLRGRGEIAVLLTVDGKKSNAVTISIK